MVARADPSAAELRRYHRYGHMFITPLIAIGQLANYDLEINICGRLKHRVVYGNLTTIKLPNKVRKMPLQQGSIRVGVDQTRESC